MNKAKRRIRACLITAILAAVFIGIVYYYYHVKDTGSMTEGTLVALGHGMWERLMGYVGR
ncbi:hypothetical protein ABXS75_05890 [Roseburia hominis]